MNIDQRLEAITMNFELAARDIADLQRNVAKLEEQTEALHRGTEEFQRQTQEFRQATVDRFAQWELQKRHVDERLDTLTSIADALLITAQAHQKRIER